MVYYKKEKVRMQSEILTIQSGGQSATSWASFLASLKASVSKGFTGEGAAEVKIFKMMFSDRYFSSLC